MNDSRRRILAILAAGLLPLIGTAATTQNASAARPAAPETASFLSLPTAANSKQAIGRILAERGKGKKQASPEITAAFSRVIAQQTGRAAEDMTLQALSCTTPWRIYNVAANQYVAAEAGYAGGDNGMLRARTPTNQSNLAWETYALCSDSSSGAVAFIATYGDSDDGNDRFVASELGYSGGDKWMLRARTPLNQANLSWETFFLGTSSDGWDLIYSSAADQYVASELGYSGGDKWMLRARTPTSQSNLSWERFFVS